MKAAARDAILSPSSRSIDSLEEEGSAPMDPLPGRVKKKTRRSASPSKLQHLRSGVKGRRRGEKGSSGDRWGMEGSKGGADATSEGRSEGMTHDGAMQ